MRAVSGAVVSSKPVALPKAARVISRFAATEGSGLPAGACALVLFAAEAAAELHAFRLARVDPEADADADADADAAPSGEKRGKKRRKREREAALLEQQ